MRLVWVCAYDLTKYDHKGAVKRFESLYAVTNLMIQNLAYGQVTVLEG